MNQPEKSKPGSVSAAAGTSGAATSRARRGDRERAQRARAHMALDDRGREDAGLRAARDRVLQAVVDVDRRHQHELRAGALVERLRGDAGEIARPVDRDRVFPGRALSSAISSASVFAGTSGCTTNT